MRVIINDANILMDLADLDLLEYLSGLKYDFHTTDFVVAEIEDESQKAKVEDFIENKMLKVVSFDAEKLKIISELNLLHTGLGITDCSVLHYSKETEGILLTGDGKLRKVAQDTKVEVRGILFIFDELVNNGIITNEYSLEKLNKLMLINSRLPVNEIQIRLEKWKK
ncbi:MAG: PIN domain-containing protein [Candidatus Delongbacteria bacterium]|nr:PIN domain-containing protein [Candidatus Delongbacteria bacterium]MCG2761310.1 PIN domain-containing protein [Candidatus Delongbacteria bacterium]